MKGCRPLEEDEIKKLDNYFTESKDRLAPRSSCLFFFGCYTGLRISEMLSIKVKDIWLNSQINSEVYIAKKFTKGKQEGKRIPIHPALKKRLEDYITNYNLQEKLESFLFFSSTQNKAISSSWVRKLYKKAFEDCDLSGKLSCHTTRKTFARRANEIVDGDLLALQTALCHKNITSTQQYVRADQEKVKKIFAEINFE